MPDTRLIALCYQRFNTKRLSLYTLLCLLPSLSACTGKLIAPVLWQKNTTQQQTTQPRIVWHTVTLGENLFIIAQKYHQHYRNIARWNHIRAPYTIYPNQRLRIAPLEKNTHTAPSKNLRQVTRLAPTSTTKPRQSCYPPQNAWQWPTQAYRYKKTFTRTGRQGLKLYGYQGQAVYASESGTVIYSGKGVNGYQGGLIIIQHNPAYLSIYAQNQRRWVAKNSRVQRGQRIADMGVNAQQQAVLHFEISCYQKTVPPLRYFSQGQTYGR